MGENSDFDVLMELSDVSAIAAVELRGAAGAFEVDGDPEQARQCLECAATRERERDALRSAAEAVAFREEAPVILRQLYDAAGVVCGENGKELVRIAIAELGLDLPEEG